MSIFIRAEAEPDLKADLLNPLLGHKEIERKHSISEAAVRRWRDRHNVTLGAVTSPYPDSARPTFPAQHEPNAQKWSPGVVIRNGEAEVCTNFGQDQSADHKRLLEDAGLNPAEWHITRISPLVRKSDSGTEMTAYWFRAVPAVTGPLLSEEEMDDILSQYTIVREWPELPLVTDRILLVPSGDLQLGKPERGGTEETIKRFARYTDEIANELRNSGPVKLLVLPWLGDCIEGLVSQNGRNIALLDIPVTQQVRVYRRLMMHQIITLAPYAENVLIPVVPGNHDQTTREQTMPHTDSWAIEGAAAAADYFRDRPGFEHLSWGFPEPGEPHLAVQVDPQLTLGFTHGHVVGSNPAKVIEWWKGQSHGRQPLGEADILVSAHWHHLRVEFTGGGRTWVQIPAMDGGSGWYRQKTGDDVPSGQITMDLTPGVGAGWTNLRVYS